MSIIKEGRGVVVSYELSCESEEANRISDKVTRSLQEDKGFHVSEVDNWIWEDNPIISITYNSLEDANRLDSTVQELISQKVA